MRNSISTGVAFLIILFVVTGQASADFFLSLRARGPGGSNNLLLTPGSTVQLTISVESLVSSLDYNGGDFDINASGGAVFNTATKLISGSGGWLPMPAAGGPVRAFSALTASPHSFTGVGQVLNLATIQLQAGMTEGVYNTNFTSVLQVNGDYLPIDTSISNFSYTVVPEPSSAMLFGLVANFALFYRRRQ